jgi:hypothetical protein
MAEGVAGDDEASKHDMDEDIEYWQRFYLPCWYGDFATKIEKQQEVQSILYRNQEVLEEENALQLQIDELRRLTLPSKMSDRPS